MLANGPIIFLAFCVASLGASIAYFNKTRPNGIAHNFGLIVMVNGIIMLAGLMIFSLLSIFIIAIRGH